MTKLGEYAYAPPYVMYRLKSKLHNQGEELEEVIEYRGLMERHTFATEHAIWRALNDD